MVFAALDLDWINTHIGGNRLPEGATFARLGHNGFVLARYPGGGKWVGRLLRGALDFGTVQKRKTGVEGVVGGNGSSEITVFTALAGGTNPGTAYVLVTIPKGLALREEKLFLTLNPGSLALVAVHALVAAWFGGDLLVLKKVKALVAAAGKIGKGDLESRIEGLHAGGLGELARAFNETAESPSSRRKVIEEAAEALKESNERFQTLLKAPPVGIVVDRRKKITMWNHAAEHQSKERDSHPCRPEEPVSRREGKPRTGIRPEHQRRSDKRIAGRSGSRFFLPAPPAGRCTGSAVGSRWCSVSDAAPLPSGERSPLPVS